MNLSLKDLESHIYVGGILEKFRETYPEKFESEEETVFYSDGIAMLTPEAAKKLMVELTRVVEKYELENGEILVREERKNCEFTDE